LLVGVSFASTTDQIKKLREKGEKGELSPEEYELYVKYGLCKPLKGFFEDSDRGWFYGEECDYEKLTRNYRKKEGKKPEEKQIPDISKADDVKYLSTLTAEQFRRLFNRVLDEASVNPTYDNVKKVVTMIDFMRGRAVKFARIWQLVLSGEESLDIRSKVPVSPIYRNIQILLKEKEAKRLFNNEMSKDSAILVFVSGSCPYCHEEMDAVHRIRAESGIYVKVISKDFCPDNFPNCIVAPNMFSRFEVNVTPTIILVVRKKDQPEFYVLSRGYTPYSEIVKMAVYFYKYSKSKKIPDY
jgi:hypothetical protein